MMFSLYRTCHLRHGQNFKKTYFWRTNLKVTTWSHDSLCQCLYKEPRTWEEGRPLEASPGIFTITTNTIAFFKSCKILQSLHTERCVQTNSSQWKDTTACLVLSTLCNFYHHILDMRISFYWNVDHAGGLTCLSKDSLQVVVAELHGSASVWVPDLKLGLGSGMVGRTMNQFRRIVMAMILKITIWQPGEGRVTSVLPEGLALCWVDHSPALGTMSHWWLSHIVCLFELIPVYLYVEVDAELEGGAAQVLRPVHLVGQPSDCHVDADHQKVPMVLIEMCWECWGWKRSKRTCLSSECLGEHHLVRWGVGRRWGWSRLENWWSWW